MNDIDIRTMLEEELERRFQRLESSDSTKPENTESVNDLVKLYGLKLEEDKLQADLQLKQDEQKLQEDKLRCDLDQQEQQRWIGYFKLGLDMIGIVLPLGFSAMWMKRGFQFEKEGSFTSQTFRWLWGHFKLPSRK